MAKWHEKIRDMAGRLRSQGVNVIRAEDGTLYLVRNTGQGQGLDDFGHKESAKAAYYTMIDKGQDANRKVLSEALGLMEQQAKDSAGLEVSLRVAERGETHYLDLGDDRGRVVKITQSGWEVVTDSPVLFRRPKGMGALPVPERGGSIGLLRELLPVDDGQWCLILGWLFGAIREKGAHYALVLQGRGGTAKTTVAEMVASVIDPSGESGQQLADLNSKREYLLLHAHSRWVAGWDEAKPLTPDKVSALKAIVTGTTYTAKANYTDKETVRCAVRRPIVLTGHTNLLDDDPFLQRSLPIWRNDPIAQTQIRAPEVVKKQLRSHLPKIWGALLDAVVAGLKVGAPDVPSGRMPRMTDAFPWIARCLQGAGLRPVSFLDALDAASKEARKEELDAWPVYAPLEAVARANFTGTAQDLLTRLTGLPLRWRGVGKWPTSHNGLMKEINERCGALEGRGIIVERQRNSKERLVILTYRQPCSGEVVPFPIHPTSPPEITQRALRLLETDPNALVCSELDDGGVWLFGGYAVHAASCLNRSIEHPPIIRLTKEEWEKVDGGLKYATFVVLT